jgi:hypothetical protein
MKRRFVLAITVALATFTVLSQAAPQTDPLFNPDTGLSYLGAFRVPTGNLGGGTYAEFDYGPYAMAYNPVNDSIFMGGHPYGNLIAELKLPAIKNSTTTGGLSTATVIQGFKDITEGHAAQICDTADQSRSDCASNDPGNIMVTPDGQKIIGTWRGYYDAGFQKRSVFTHSTNLAAASFNGFYAPTPPGSSNRPAAGWLLSIPTGWQSLLGGDLASGACCYGITSTSGFGPNLYSFSSSALNGAGAPNAPNSILGSRLMEFMGENDFGQYNCTNASGAYSPSTCTTVLNNKQFVLGDFGSFPRVAGWVGGTRTVVIAGWQGQGQPCYDPGCVDPCNSTKGSHAYPYTWQMWFFDANDLLAVKQGTKTANSVRPYAIWADLPSPRPSLPYPSGTTGFRGSTPFNDGCVLGGSFGPFSGAYDYAHNRLFLAQVNADSTAGSFYPIVHVWQFAGTGMTPPTAPTNVRIIK